MDEAAVHGEDAGRTVDVAVALALRRHGSGARGCPDTPAAVRVPEDDLDVRKRTRVDVHDVRALHCRRARRLRGRANGIAAVGHGVVARYGLCSCSKTRRSMRREGRQALFIYLHIERVVNRRRVCTYERIALASCVYHARLSRSHSSAARQPRGKGEFSS